MKAEVMQEIEYRTGKTTFLRADSGRWFKVSTWPDKHDMELEHSCGKPSRYMTLCCSSRHFGDTKPELWGRNLIDRKSHDKAAGFRTHEAVVGLIQRTGEVK